MVFHKGFFSGLSLQRVHWLWVSIGRRSKWLGLYRKLNCRRTRCCQSILHLYSSPGIWFSAKCSRVYAGYRETSLHVILASLTENVYVGLSFTCLSSNSYRHPFIAHTIFVQNCHYGLHCYNSFAVPRIHSLAPDSYCFSALIIYCSTFRPYWKDNITEYTARTVVCTLHNIAFKIRLCHRYDLETGRQGSRAIQSYHQNRTTSSLGLGKSSFERDPHHHWLSESRHVFGDLKGPQHTRTVRRNVS